MLDDYIDTNTIKKLKPYMDDDVDIIKFKLQRVNEQGEILEKCLMDLRLQKHLDKKHLIHYLVKSFN